MFCPKKWSVLGLLIVTVSLPGKGSEGVSRMGLLWAENHRVTASQRQKYLIEVKDWVENSLGARLVKSYERKEIPLSVVHLEQRKQDLLQYAQDSIQDESQINRKMAQLPKGVFSPEIQGVKVRQAQFWWSKKKYKKMERLLEEARGLHPQGELVFLSENAFGAPVEWEVFESSVNQWLSRHPIANQCRIKGLSEKNGVEIVANGFRIDRLKSWIHPGTFLFQWIDEKGRQTAQILRCVRSEELTLGAGVSEKMRPISRIDQLLRDESNPPNTYVLIVPNDSGFDLFTYQKEEGLNLISDSEKKLNSSPLFVNLHYQVPEKKVSEWYNKNTTWWWLGGLLLVASTAYFVEAQLSQEQSIGWKVRIKGLP